MQTYTAMQISAHIINTYKRLGENLSNTRLQKLLYIIHVRYLVRHGIPAFYDKIEKWKLGPCVPDVYSAYKWQGPRITYVEKVAQYSPTAFIPFILVDEKPLALSDQQEVASVLFKTQHMTTIELIEATRGHHIYSKDRSRVEQGERLWYFRSEIEKHYKENPEDII